MLHTWTRDLRFHAHLHCIVTGGGLTADGHRWVPARQGFLFPARVLADLFRGKLMAALSAASRAGELKLSGSCANLPDPRSFAELKDRLYRTKWVAYCKKPFAGPEQVFRYLGRYTHRVGLSNQRLLRLSEEGVQFRTRGDATKTLASDEFIHRFLQHVLPDGFVKIRHYGLMASGNATTKLEVARRLLQGCPRIPRVVAALVAMLLAVHPPVPVPLEDWRSRLKRLTGLDVGQCPACRVGTMLPLALLRRAKPLDDTS